MFSSFLQQSQGCRQLQESDPTSKMSQEATVRIRGKRDFADKRAPAKARVPMAQNVPSPEEENPRVSVWPVWPR